MRIRRFFVNQTAGSADETPKVWIYLFWIALVFLLVQFSLAFAQNFQTVRGAVAFPYPLDYKEGPALNQVVRLAQGQTVYRADLTSPPFSIAYDPPLYWLVQAPFVRLLGPSYAYGRVIALLCALAAALFIGLTLYTITQDGLGAAVSGLTLLAFPYILYGSVLDQPDSLALALSWAGLFTVVRWPEKKASLAAAALLFTLAIFTRQTYFLAAPLTGFAWLVFQRSRRQAWQLVGLTVGFCAAAFLITNLLTQGAFFYTVIQANTEPFSWKALTANYSLFFPDTYYLFVSSALFLIVERISDRSQTWPFVLPYFISAFIVSMFSGWAGSTVTAFFELIAAFAFAAGAILVWLKHTTWLKLFLVLLLAVQVGDLTSWSAATFIPQVTAKIAVRHDLDQLNQMVRDSGGRVLADEYLGMIPLAGQPILFQPIEFKTLNEHGRWDNQPIITQIRQKKFPLILFYIPVDNAQYLTERWSPEIRAAVYANYRLADSLASVYIYKPKP